MIKFFRKIRHKLLTENKFSRYLIYAIGEIILVVIGILIALSINTWNEDRLNQIEKNELVSKLNAEFKENKSALVSFREIEYNAQLSSTTLMNLIGASRQELSSNNLDSLFFESFPATDLAFANNIVNSIVQTDQLKYFRNAPITDLLNQWNASYDVLRIRNERRDAWTNELFLPYLLPFISFKEMDSNTNYKWTGSSKLKPDYYPLFQRVEFENLLDNSMFLQQVVIDRLIALEAIADEVIEMTNL